VEQRRISALNLGPWELTRPLAGEASRLAPSVDVSIASTVRYSRPTHRRRSAIMRPLDRPVFASP